jgi:hypothetical protein
MGRAQNMSFHIEVELRRGLFYARLRTLEVCYTNSNGWTFSRAKK